MSAPFSMSVRNNAMMGEIYSNIGNKKKSSKISTHSVYMFVPFSISETTAPHQLECRRNKNPIHLPWCSKMAEWDWNGVKWYYSFNLTHSMICLRYLIFSYALTYHCWSWTQIFLSKYWLIISRQPVLYTTHSFCPIVNSTYKDKICHILQTFPMANFAKFSLAPAPAGLSKLS